MKRFVLALILLVVPAVAPAIAAPPEMHAQVRDRMQENVQAAMMQRRFDQLEAWGNEYRTTKARSPNGDWMLRLYYLTLSELVAVGFSAEAERTSFIQSWQSAYPASPVPTIVLAKYYIMAADRARGATAADQVFKKEWETYAGLLGKAAATLEAGEQVSRLDPEWHATWNRIVFRQGVEEADFLKVVERGLAAAPDYPTLYDSAVWYYLPQWYGSAPKLNAFIDRMAKRQTLVEPDAFYAWIYVSIFSTLSAKGAVETYGIDWPRVKRGGPALLKAFNDVEVAHPMQKLACDVRDGEFVRDLLRIQASLRRDFDPEAIDVAKFCGWKPTPVQVRTRSEQIPFGVPAAQFVGPRRHISN